MKKFRWQILTLGLALATVVGGVAAMFITGGQARVATGMEAMAKTASAVDLPISSLVRDDRFFVPVQAVAAPAPAPASQASVSQPK